MSLIVYIFTLKSNKKLWLRHQEFQKIVYSYALKTVLLSKFCQVFSSLAHQFPKLTSQKGKKKEGYSATEDLHTQICQKASYKNRLRGKGTV